MIRLLLVDDQVLVCAGLKAVLEIQPDFEVVGIAHNGEEAISMVEALQPDIVLMDVQMPIMDGRAATRVICDRFPNVNVLVLSTFDDDEYLDDALQAGAVGYLLKGDMPPEQLAQAIRLASQGYGQLAPKLLPKLRQRKTISTTKLQPSAQVLEELTPRERQVLRLLATGATNKKIADELFISEGTVKTHVKHLFERLGCDNRTEVGIMAALLFADQE